MKILVFFLLFVWGISAVLCYDFARQKGRNKYLWFALALPFGFVALVALLRACAGNPLFGFDPDRKTAFSTPESGQISSENAEITGGPVTGCNAKTTENKGK